MQMIKRFQRRLWLSVPFSFFSNEGPKEKKKNATTDVMPNQREESVFPTAFPSDNLNWAHSQQFTDKCD